METVVITGGAGFIGSNFVRKVLAETGWRVVVLDKLTYAGNLCSLEDVITHPRFTFVQGDIADPARLQGILQEYQPNWIVNVAAETHVDRSIDDPRPFVTTNIVGTSELLEASRRYLANLHSAEKLQFRFLHISTDEVYGTLGTEGLFSETTAYAPNSPYAASKAAADHLVRAYCETYRLPVIITNCSNNYGPYQFPEKLIPLTLLNAMEGKPLPIYGDGGNIRDWLFVEDHCAGILLALRHGQTGEKYNIGGGNECTNLEIVDRVCEYLEQLMPASGNVAMQRRSLTRYASLKTFVEDRPGHDRRYAIDAGKIRRDLGWAPAHSLEAGLKKTIRWYCEHLSWCRTVLAGKYARERLGLSV